MMDTCGAKTRAGTPCKQKTIYWNGRCKFHGGLATGPITEAGKEQSRINGRKGGRPRKADAVLSDVAISEASGETEVMEPKKTHVSPPLLGKDSGRVAASELQALERPELTPEKPKSWMLKDVKVSARCERCTMFASNGACLAVAKGAIKTMTTGDTCAAFSAF